VSGVCCVCSGCRGGSAGEAPGGERITHRGCSQAKLCLLLLLCAAFCCASLLLVVVCILNGFHSVIFFIFFLFLLCAAYYSALFHSATFIVSPLLCVHTGDGPFEGEYEYVRCRRDSSSTLHKSLGLLIPVSTFHASFNRFDAQPSECALSHSHRRRALQVCVL